MMAEQVTPQPERPYGTVLPGGRGMELHGVQQYGGPDLVDQTELGDLVEPAKEPPKVDPVPVRIVSNEGRERRLFRVNRVVANPDRPMVAGMNETRSNLRIRNMDAARTVYVSGEQHLASAAYGYPILPGVELQITAEGPVFAGPDDGTSTVPLAVLLEYSAGT